VRAVRGWDEPKEDTPTREGSNEMVA